jgi:hypothetical protein
LSQKRLVRKGECNGCGECCLILCPVRGTITIEIPGGDRDWLKARGLRVMAFRDAGPNTGQLVEVEVDGTLNQPCPHLFAAPQDWDWKYVCDLTARVQGAVDDRPQWCKDFPTLPEHVARLPKCGYYFEEGHHVEILDDRCGDRRVRPADGSGSSA